MTGTEKQVAWALDIKAEMIRQMAAFIDSKKAGLSAEGLAKVEAQRATILAAYESKTDAAWWIENAKGGHWQHVAKAILAVSTK